MLHGVPVVAHDLVALFGDRILVLPTADVAVESAGFHPGRFEERSLGAGAGHDDVRFAGGGFEIGLGSDEGHVREEGGHLADELIFLGRFLGGHATFLEIGNGGFHCDEVHLRLLTGSDETDDLGVLAGEVLGGQSAHCSHPDVRAKGAFHEGDGKSVDDLGENDDRAEVLQSVQHRVLWENGDPFDSANLLLEESGRQAIDELLSVLTENLNDFLGEKNVTVFVGQDGILRRIHGEVHIETSRAKEVFLGEILAADFVWVAHEVSEGSPPRLDFGGILTLHLLLFAGLPLTGGGMTSLGTGPGRPDSRERTFRIWSCGGPTKGQSPCVPMKVLLPFFLLAIIAPALGRDLGELKPLFHSALDFYGKLQRTPTGMYRDSYLVGDDIKQGQRCSTAAVGVGLIALCMEHELNRDPEAPKKALQTLRALNGKAGGFTPSRGKAGFYGHFFSAETGASQSEHSTIDTAIMVVGALFCRNTFDDPGIKKEADLLWNSIDWEVALARPDGSRLHMVMEEGKPKPRTVTQMFNEYYLLAWLIQEAQVQKRAGSKIITIAQMPTWNNDGIRLLAEPRKTPQPSFIIQFPFYLSHPCTLDPRYRKFVLAQGQADRRKGKGHLWGAGAGVTPDKGYVAASYDRNPGRVVSPRIIAGFMPAMPEAREDLLKLSRNSARRLKTPVGDLLPRFSLEKPDWRPMRIESIDFASMLFGLAGIHPDLGMKFFHERSKFTFGAVE